MTLDEGVARLLEQCDREDANTPDRRFLYTSEIRHLLGLVPWSPSPAYLSMAPSVITELDGIDVNSSVEVRKAMDAAKQRLGADLVITVSGRRPQGSMTLVTEAALVICRDCAGLVKDRHGHHLANGAPGCTCHAA